MPRKPFFSDGPAEDIIYTNIRDARNDHTSKAREMCEKLWEIFEPYADPEFLTEIRKEFDARYWEMYLTIFFIKTGYKVTCLKPGPDVGIELEGKKIWFEATCPTRGQDGHPDQVPERIYAAPGEEPIVYEVPNEKLILRYLNSIATKYSQQYASWIESKIISPEDSFFIAINPRRLGFEYADTAPPRILQAAFHIGNPYVSIDRKTSEQIEAGYVFRDRITKSTGTEIPTGIFLQREYSNLSGLLCSRIDVANQPLEMGKDFQLILNPNAKNQPPKSFRLIGTFSELSVLKMDL